MKKLFITFVFVLLATVLFAQQTAVYPAHWWTGMKNGNLQLMLHGSNIADNSFTINYPGVKLV